MRRIQKVSRKVLAWLLTIVIICSTVLTNGFGIMVDRSIKVEAATTYKLTEEQLFMLAPAYLINQDMDAYYAKCYGYCLEALDSVSGAEEGVAIYLEGLKSGTKYLIKEGASLLGVTSSNFDSVNKEVAGELMKNYFSEEDNIAKTVEEISEGYDVITTTYDKMSSAVIADIKKHDNTHTDEQIDAIFKDTKLAGKIMGKFNDAKDVLDAYVTIVELNQIELESLDMLISVTANDSALMDGLLDIRADITDNLVEYLIRNYGNDKALDKIASAITKNTIGVVGGGTSIIVGLIVNIGTEIYSNFKPSLSDIMYANLLESYTTSIDNSLSTLQMKFIKGTATKYDIEKYRVTYDFFVASLKLWMQKCKSLLKTGNKRLQSSLEVCSDSLGTVMNYDAYLRCCLGNATKAINAGTLKISGDTATKYTSDGVKIDENYDSKESIAARFAVIQAQYKPNVGQAWTGSYNGAIQCCGFAQLVFNKLFGYNLSGYYGDRRYMIRAEDRAIKVGQLVGSNVTLDNVKALFSQAKLGDYIQVDGATYGQHSAIFVSADDTGVTIYDCNSKPHGETTGCLINQWKVTWANWVSWYGKAPSGRQNGISVYRATNYAEIYGDGGDLFYDDTVNFVIVDGVLTKYNGWQTHVVIPDEVTAIGDSAFKNNTTMMSIEIPEGVTSIGASAFYGCTSLLCVNIPDSVESIGDSAFYGCTSLASVYLPKNEKFTVINSSTFSGCSVLKGIGIPDSVTKINSEAFYQCGKLGSINIPDSVTYVANRAFYNCIGAKSLKLSNNLIGLGYSVFYNCDGLEAVTIPKSLDYCDRELYSVFVTIFNPGPFGACDNLKNVTFEDGTKEIATYLFADCSGIEEVVIPSTVTKIEYGAFMCCQNLREVSLPNSITCIEGVAFSSCDNIENIKLPSSLVRLGGKAFYDCDNISEVSVGKKLEDVGFMNDSQLFGPFANCKSLNKILFEEGISEIPDYLFRNCTGLEEITIPSTIQKLGWNSFAECTKLKEVNIPDSVTEIGPYAFLGCSSMESIIIPDSVQKLGFSAFCRCSSLKDVKLSNNLERLNSSTFSNCTELEEIIIPNAVNSIGSDCFYNCISLTKLSIPKNVNTIYDSAFSHCEALTELHIAEGVSEIYYNAFEYCISLQSVTLPDSMQSIGSYAFRYCDALSEVNLGAGLKVIPSYCFYEDPALEKVVLPQQVTTVNEYAFGNCTKFTDITMNRNVSTITANAFSYPDKLTIHGVSGTYPETFAAENEITFVALDTPATAIRLNATEQRLARGYTAQMTANITPADASDELTWTSTDEDIVTVDANGKIEGVATGTASIIAMAGDVMELCEVTVYEKVTGVYIDGYSKTMATGETYQLSATVYPSNAENKNITWSSSDERVATVDETGLVTAVAYGTATITVTTEDSGYTDTFTVTVEPIAVTGVSLNAKTAVVGVQSTYQLVATITPQNATEQGVTWTSSKPAVATVEDGMVTGVSEGTAIIIAKTKDGAKTASCTVTVKDLSVTGITLDKTELSMDSKTSYQLTESILPAEATNKHVTWSCDNEKVATVDRGIVTALRAGTATITVTTEDGGFTASCVVTVTGKDVTGVALAKETLSMEVGNRAYVEPTVSPANADDASVIWSSSDETIASIDPVTGVITAHAAGTATITVTTNDGGYEAACEVTVTEPEETETTVKVTGITINPLEEDVQVGDTFTLTASITPEDATNQSVIWLSSDVDVADINQNGEVTTYTVGEVTFTAIAVDGGKSAEYTVAVLPVSVTAVELNDAELVLKIGESKQLEYSVSPESATNQNVTWSSSDTSVATVSNSGMIQTLGVGTTTITVTTEDGNYTDTCELTVQPVLVHTINLSATNVAMKIGDVEQLSATVLPDNATDSSIVWSSGNEAVATVDAQGRVTAVAEGNTNIVATAADGSRVKGICMVTVAKKQEESEKPGTDNPGTTNPGTDNPGTTNPGTDNPGTQEPGTADVLPKVGKVVTLSGGQYKVTKSGAEKKEVTYVKPKSSKITSVSIPSTIKLDGKSYKVTAIANKAFSGCTKLKTVKLGSNVTSIGDKAFYKCSALTGVLIPAKVTTIGKYAFYGCKKVTSVTIGKNVSKIGSKAFYGCSKIKTLTIHSTKLTTTKIGSSAFSKTPKNMTVKMPKKKYSTYQSMLIKRGVNKKAKFKKS